MNTKQGRTRTARGRHQPGNENAGELDRKGSLDQALTVVKGRYILYVRPLARVDRDYIHSLRHIK